MKKIIGLVALILVANSHSQGQNNIVKVEYFINTDPGFGRATTIPVTPATNLNNIEYTVPVAALTSGLQTLFIRSADANNTWSVAGYLVFLKTALPPAVNLSAAEYFIDTDPGFGLATPISLTANATTVADRSVVIDISASAPGLHTVYLRSKDTNGKWSITGNLVFLKASYPPETNIVKAEYFIDRDPGFDLAIPVNKTINTIIAADIMEQVNIENVPEGLHQLYIRAKDARGKWSITNNLFFYKTGALPGNVNEVEYFIDTDPGFGNGQKFPAITPAATVSDISATIDLKAVDSGIHRLFIRSKNAANKWSITNFLQFRKTDALPLTQLSFEAAALNNQVLLEWQTANEQSTDRFEVEHATDGVSFKKVGSLPASGYSTTAKNYRFLHTTPQPGSMNYYRIRQVDKDDKFTYSPVRSVKLMAHQTFAINPNPVRDNLTIYTTEKNLTLHIFESTGRRLITRKLESASTIINFSSMLPGIYFAVAEKGGQPVHTQKIFKQ